jgi:PAS domain S-box-containing protein
MRQGEYFREFSMKDEDKTKAELISELVRLRAELQRERGEPVFSKNVTPSDANGTSHGQTVVHMLLDGTEEARSREEFKAEIEKRKRTEEELRKAKDELELRVWERTRFNDSILNSLPGIFYLFDEKGNFFRWNHNFERDCGYSPEEISKITPLDFFEGKDKEVISRAIREVFTKGTSSAEAEFVSKDGRKKSYLFSGSLVSFKGKNYLAGLGIDIRERKEMEEELRKTSERLEEERARLRAIIDGVPEGIVVADEFSRITMANIAAGWLYEHPTLLGGYRLRGEYFEACGTPCPPQDFPLARSARTGETIINEELHVLLPDGRRRDLLVNSAPIRQKGIKGSVAVLQDITARKLADKERRDLIEKLEATSRELNLQAKELRSARDELGVRITERTAELLSANEELEGRNELLESIFSTVHFLIAYMDSDLNFIRVNEAYAQADGRTPQSFIGRSHFELYPNEENEVIFRKVLETGEPYFAHEKAFDYAEHPERGGTYWDWSVHPVKGRDEKVRGLVLSLVDVTDRKLAETARLESEQQFRRLVETINEGIGAYDERGRVTYVNDKLCRMIGYTKSDVIGRSVLEFFDEENQRILEAQIEKRSRGERSSYEIEYRAKDGRRIPTLVSGSPIYDEQGHYSGSIFALTDITVLKRAEQKLKAYTSRLELVNSELQEFAFVAAHDLQEPLRKIQAFGNRLRNKCEASLEEDGCDYLRRMESAANRMQTLLHGLLGYSRVATRAEAFVPVDLTRAASDAVSDLELTIELAEGKVEIDSLPVIDADPPQMQQLMQNLIGNALKYSREGIKPVIKIYGAVEGEICRIFVEDNGIGFDEKYLERIFKPFQRLHGRSAYEGIGMGLAICRKVVERHGGAITARSTPGQGSTFIVSLPIRQSAAEDLQVTFSSGFARL